MFEIDLSKADKEKKQRDIRAEKKRLNTLLADLPEDKKKAAEGLIDECAFMRATLKQLRLYIDEHGILDEMAQGNYSIIRESPAVRTYNTMVQKYSAVCKQLFDMLPTKKPEAADDGFDDFRAIK